jgi:hypothetical protein
MKMRNMMKGGIREQERGRNIRGISACVWYKADTKKQKIEGIAL